MPKKDNQNGAFRKKVKFAMVSAVALKDKNLSLRAKGLYSMIQNYITLEDFIIYKNYLVSICGDGKSSFDRAWDELKMNGYLKQYLMQDKEGKIYYEYELLDEPVELTEEEKKAYDQKEANRIARNKRKTEKQKQKKQPQVEVPPTDKTIDGSSMHGSSTNGSSTYLINTDLSQTELNQTDLITTETPKDAVVTQQEEIILNNTNIKELTDHQKKKVSTWDIDTLIRAIQIYKNMNGLYFKLLEKIYTDGAKESLVTKKQPTQTVFSRTYSHGWNLEELEKKEMEILFGKA